MSRPWRKSRHWRCETVKHYHQPKWLRAWDRAHPGPYVTRVKRSETITRSDLTNILLGQEFATSFLNQKSSQSGSQVRFYEWERIQEEFRAYVMRQAFEELDRAIMGDLYKATHTFEGTCHVLPDDPKLFLPAPREENR